MPYADPERQRQYQREWMAKRRAEWIDANGPCAWCSSDYRLEVDHIDPETKVSHRVWSWSTPRREVELEKCHVLCIVCHEKKCQQEGTGARLARHGLARYRKGCRCRICKDAELRKWHRNQASRRARGVPLRAAKKVNPA